MFVKKAISRPSLFRSLDLSFNLLRRVPKDQLSGMESLGMLYFIQNKISMIEGLDNIASSLTSIEFGGNKLRVRTARFEREIAELRMQPQSRR